MYDYVIISRCLRTSLLDTQVFRGIQLDTDHELVVSTFHFKIKRQRTPEHLAAKERGNHLEQHTASLLHNNHKGGSFHRAGQEPGILHCGSVWQSLKDALMEAEHGLPDLLSVPVKDWVSKVLTNLLRKKNEAWMRLCNAKANNPNLSKLQQQYNTLHSRTNRAAQKAKNHWWSTKVAKEKEHMRVGELNGRGESLIETCTSCVTMHPNKQPSTPS